MYHTICGEPKIVQHIICQSLLNVATVDLKSKKHDTLPTTLVSFTVRRYAVRMLATYRPCANPPVQLAAYPFLLLFRPR